MLYDWTFSILVPLEKRVFNPSYRKGEQTSMK